MAITTLASTNPRSPAHSMTPPKPAKRMNQAMQTAPVGMKGIVNSAIARKTK